MTDNVVARRYADALFAIGREAGAKELSQYGEELDSLNKTLGESPEIEHVLQSPVVGVHEKSDIVKQLLESMSASRIFSNFCLLLAEKGRLPYLRKIGDHYADLLDAENNVVRGSLTSAVALDAKKQGQIKAQLKKKSGKDIELSFNVDPSILGGMVLTVGDRVLDASLRAQLSNLREIIKRGE